MPARNTLVQLLALYTNPTMHSVTNRLTDRQTDDMMMPIADHAAVRSAKSRQYLRDKCKKVQF